METDLGLARGVLGTLRFRRVLPTVDLSGHVRYLSLMRRHVRSLARLLTLAFGLSVSVPFLLCGVGPVTSLEASACCRAMQFKCHKADGGSACCKHLSAAPVQPAIASASRLGPPHALATVGVLPVALINRLFPGQLGGRLFDEFAAHSPPGRVPLFLLHSTFLI